MESYLEDDLQDEDYVNQVFVPDDEWRPTFLVPDGEDFELLEFLSRPEVCPDPETREIQERILARWRELLEQYPQPPSEDEVRAGGGDPAREDG